MEQEQVKRSGILGGVAKALNVTGSVLVVSYDSSLSFIGKTFSKVITVTPSLPRATVDFFAGAKNIFTGGLRIFKPGEEREIESKIGEYEEKIRAAYNEIGKEGASAEQLESESVRKLINDVKEYEKEIQRLKDRVAEIEELRKEQELSNREEKAARKKVRVPESHVMTSVRNAIDRTVKHGDFETGSDRAIFEKIAGDLLDNEMEIKILAASELGKIGNRAAVPVLYEAVKFDNPYLTSEIINSLINLEDPKSVSLFRETVTDPSYRVRMVSLRGLYKLGEEKETALLLIDALRDEHPAVRKTAATFIGWKDYPDAVPGLVQTLQDKDETVRKAAVTALANIKEPAAVLPLMRVLADKSLEIREKALEAIKMITGEDIKLDVELSGQALTEAIEGLKEKYHRERLGKAGVVEPATEEAEAEETIEKAVQPEQVAEVEDITEEEEEEESEEEQEEVEEVEYTEYQLKKKTKAELIVICEEFGIECDESLTKAEIINLLLE
jgi:hypothetical protein